MRVVYISVVHRQVMALLTFESFFNRYPESHPVTEPREKELNSIMRFTSTTKLTFACALCTVVADLVAADTFVKFTT
jgi:hypothetical protein